MPPPLCGDNGRKCPEMFGFLGFTHSSKELAREKPASPTSDMVKPLTERKCAPYVRGWLDARRVFISNA